MEGVYFLREDFESHSIHGRRFESLESVAFGGRWDIGNWGELMNGNGYSEEDDEES